MGCPPVADHRVSSSIISTLFGHPSVLTQKLHGALGSHTGPSAPLAEHESHRLALQALLGNQICTRPLDLLPEHLCCPALHRNRVGLVLLFESNGAADDGLNLAHREVGQSEKMRWTET